MDDKQVLLALKKMLLIIDSLDSRINRLEDETSPIIDDLSNLRWYLSFLEKTVD